jgi:hypothetical protein
MPPDDEPAKPTTNESSSTMPAAPLPPSNWTPEDLQASLLQIPEVWLQPPNVPTVPKTGRAGGRTHPLLGIVDARPDLRGLPVKRGPDVQLPSDEADAFRDISVLVRKGLGDLIGQTGGGNRRLSIRPEVLSARPQVVARVMHQMMQNESVPLRKILLGQLKQNRNAAATKALAHRAVYEPVADLRALALKALTNRTPSDYLPVVLDAFKNPWAPAADHAADVLAALTPGEAIPGLIRALETPDPNGIVYDSQGAPVVRELVRINHARNCLLCHAQSVDRSDGIRVAVPSPIRPLPPPFSLDGYEGGGRGGSRGTRSAVFSRPDITYLQQDFSWMLPVANSGPWPALQRFDFVVRSRPVEESDQRKSAELSPQRKAAIRALRAISGKDFGEGADDWRKGLAFVNKS